jgi:hypothetical protein
MLCCKKELVLGSGEIKLDNLRNSSTLNGDFAILPAEGPDTGFKGAKIGITIQLRNPTVGREYTTVSKLTFQITKTFPSFKAGGGTIATIPEKKLEPIKEEPKIEKKPEPKKPEPEKPKAKPKMAEFSEDDFKPEELEDPDFIENLSSLKVLELKIKGVEAEVAKIEGRAPPKLREKLLKMRVKYKVTIYLILVNRK